MRIRLVLILATILSLVAPAARAEVVKGHVTTPSGEPVADAVVFIDDGPAATSVSTRGTAVMDQVNKEFVPHVLVIPAGTAVRFPNHDGIHHHVYSFSRLKSFDLPLYKDEEPGPVVFERAGVVRVGCNIHDWMSGIILVVPTSRFAITGTDGGFELADVPSGSHTLVAWHEHSERKVDETAQVIAVGSAPPTDVRFALPLQSARERPSVHGGREYR